MADFLAQGAAANNKKKIASLERKVDILLDFIKEGLEDSNPERLRTMEADLRNSLYD